MSKIYKSGQMRRVTQLELKLENKLADLKRKMLDNNKHLLNQERQLREQIIFEQEALSIEINENEKLKIEYSKLHERNKIKETDFEEARIHVATLNCEVKTLRLRNSELQYGLTNEANLSAENIKKLRYSEIENAKLRESLQLSGNTVKELQARVQKAENSLAMYITNQKLSNFSAGHEYFESHQTNRIQTENKLLIKNDLKITEEKLSQCETNLKIKDEKIKEMTKEIMLLQKKREKKNIDMKMLMYDKKQLELRLSGNPWKRKIRVIELP